MKAVVKAVSSMRLPVRGGSSLEDDDGAEVLGIFAHKASRESTLHKEHRMQNDEVDATRKKFGLTPSPLPPWPWISSHLPRS